MTKLYGFSSILIALILSVSAHAGDIQVENAWSRATVPGQDNGMVDVTISSKQAATLVGVSTNASNKAELHSMSHEGGMMKMREVKAIELPAGKPVNLGDNGYHVMLIGLKEPLKAGDKVPLTLSIMTGQQVTRVETSAEVKPLTEAKSAEHDSEHMHHHH